MGQAINSLDMHEVISGSKASRAIHVNSRNMSDSIGGVYTAGYNFQSTGSSNGFVEQREQ